MKQPNHGLGSMLQEEYILIPREWEYMCLEYIDEMTLEFRMRKRRI